MFSQIAILHRKSSSPLKLGVQWLVWKTCVREIAFSHQDSLDFLEQISPDDEIYVGQDAYQFCLEVICGLHSPLMGETEIGGQFKQLVQNTPLDSTIYGAMLNKFFQSLFADFKDVRSQYLLNLGSHSYGSLVRKLFSTPFDVHILGAGQLVEEILPWLNKCEKQVVVYCRRLEQGKELKEIRTNLLVQALNPDCLAEKSGYVVIAAPMSAAEIKVLLSSMKQINCLVDLRGESQADPVEMDFPIWSLQDLFDQVRDVENSTLQKVQEAKSFITQKSVQRFSAAHHRPYGWDDLCL